MLQPEWQIDFPEYLERLHLTERHFRKRLRLPMIGQVKKVLPLRELKEIHSVIPASQELLGYLIANIKTLSGELPFAKAKIEMLKLDPQQLRIGQKFAYRENYVQLLEELSDIFRQKYAINSGAANLGAFLIFGEDADGVSALAYYLPPIVEQHKDELVIMDGIHRNYITLQVGTTITAILVRNIQTPFPCSGHNWQEIRVISLNEKPADIRDRYFDLHKELFRDLKYLGIDG
ncbi:MAG: hypothetical protein AAB885_00550 [Patescibacteria group bacterium]